MLSVGQTATGNVTTTSEIDTYILQGLLPGDRATLCMSRTSGTINPFLELFDGEGTQVGAAPDKLTATVPAVSPYVAFARDNGYNSTGTYTITLRGALSSCAGSDITSPSVTTLAPQPGELVTGGSSYLIRWSSSDDVGVTAHDLKLSTDGGATFPITIASGLSGAAQSYLWSIPPTLHSTRARIQVIARDATSASGQGTTPGDFLLVDNPPLRTITYTYDSLNQLVGVVYSDGSTIAYTYDAVGNRLSMISTEAVGMLPFVDGFETGNTSGWSEVFP